MKKIILLGFVFVLSLSTFFGTCFIPLLAENPETKIYVDPQISTASLGETFNLRVNITQAENVYSWQFKLSWDPTVLEVQDAQEGGFLSQGGVYKTQFQEYINNEAGNLVVVCLFLGEPRASSASGDGTLATVTFYAKAEGYTPLHLYDTELTDYDILELPHTSEDGCFLHARFTYTPTIPSVGEATMFNASVSSDVDKDVMSYRWNFDDGNISPTVDSIIVHAYEFVGTFNVTLTVFYSEGWN